MKPTEFDIRMKDYYERRAKTALTRRIPVIVRIDGKSFHTFCKRFERPYDSFLNDSLNKVMVHLCKEIQGVKFAERHSDEISLLLTDFDTHKTDAFYDYEVQKLCSVAAAMATSEFCRQLIVNGSTTFKINPELSPTAFIDGGQWDRDEIAYESDMTPLSLNEKWPMFDCRCHNIPLDEMQNYFWWRMTDAKRNSVSMTAQANFSHAQLQGKSSNEMQEMLWQEKDINWSKLPQGQKIGFYCIREKVMKPIPDGPRKGESVERSVWSLKESPTSRSGLSDIFEDIRFVKENAKRTTDQTS